MKAGIHNIIMKIHEDAERHSGERFVQIKSLIDGEIEGENALYSEESGKQREVLTKHNEHEYARRLEYQRSRLNRELLIYQHELIDEIFDKVVAKLRDVSSSEFSGLFKIAVKKLKGSFIVYLGELSEGKIDNDTLQQAQRINAGLKMVLSTKTIPQKSGFMLSDERVEYNHLFEDLVEDLKSERTSTIMKEVFGNSTDWMFGSRE